MCDDMQFFFFLNYPDVGKAGLVYSAIPGKL